MKLSLNKRNLKQLSLDDAVLPGDMTPQVAGGLPWSWGCWTHGCTDSGVEEDVSRSACGTGNCHTDDGASA